MTISRSLSQAIDSQPPSFETVALAIAADEYPGLRTERYRSMLDDMAQPLLPKLRKTVATHEQCHELCDYVYGKLGFRGNDDYDDPRNNYLNEVLDRRLGTPITLVVLLVALGCRAGMQVQAIAYPGHSLVRVGQQEPIYVDPFDGGFPLAWDRLAELATETLDGDRREAERRLEPVGARTIAVRILLNLQRIYRARADHAHLLVVCDRLFEVTGAPFHQCDRGIHALALGATRTAITDLEAYLTAHPKAADAAQVRRVLDKARGAKSTPPS